jgi:hypothetical protein
MTKAKNAVLVMGLAYVVGIAMLYAFGEGIAAAYLTLPGGLPVFYLTDWAPPDSVLEAAIISWTGNLVALLVSAVLNVAGVYVLVRLLSKT